MRHAQLHFYQPYHKITEGVVAPQSEFYAKMPFEGGRVWVWGRRPEPSDLPLHTCIQIYNPAVTANLFKIIAISGRADIHLLESLTNDPKQFTFLKGKPLIKQVLKDGDVLSVGSFPFSLTYRIVEEGKVRGEDDTVSFVFP